MRSLKENRVSVDGLTAAEFTARRLAEEMPSFTHDFLGSGQCLVPIPRSSLQKSHALWPGFENAAALADRLPGLAVKTLVRRVHPVPKASVSASGERSSAELHQTSLDVAHPLDIPDRLTLVDDVITRGSQALGAAWAKWRVRPEVSIRVFAAIRTVSHEHEFSGILDSTTGRISLVGDRVLRRP